MKNTFVALAVVLATVSAFAGNHDPKAIIPLLKGSKVSLLEGIDYAEKTSGVATSAKFEVSDDKLVLSVYTIPEGLGVEPEKATLTELSGPASEGASALAPEVFADKEHIARASVHMTLFQLSKFTLKEVIQKALRRQPGQAIDVRNPVVRNRRPVADVIIATDCENEAAVTVSVDLLSGRTTIL
jgi:hypothetical protein